MPEDKFGVRYSNRILFRVQLGSKTERLVTSPIVVYPRERVRDKNIKFVLVQYVRYINCSSYSAGFT